jgi:hypothetical protein
LARIDHNFIGTIPATFLSESANGVDRQGWTVGGSLEWMFAPWSVFGEYSYMDFRRKDIAFIAGPATIGAADVVSTRLTIQQALVGVNYKFIWGGPLVQGTDFSPVSRKKLQPRHRSSGAAFLCALKKPGDVCAITAFLRHSPRSKARKPTTSTKVDKPKAPRASITDLQARVMKMPDGGGAGQQIVIEDRGLMRPRLEGRVGLVPSAKADASSWSVRTRCLNPEPRDHNPKQCVI